MFRFIISMLMCFLYIVQALIPLAMINTFYTLICIIAFLLAFWKLQRKNKLFTGFLFGTGILIHFFYGNGGLRLFEGITQNLALLSIILLAPLIFLPLEGEGIIESVMSKLKGWKKDQRKTFFGVGAFMMMLAPILNMGAIRVVHGFVGRLSIEPKFLSHIYFGGFTPAIVWSPFFASVGIAISLAEMPYVTYMPFGILFF